MLLLHWQKVRDPLQGKKKKKKRAKPFSCNTDREKKHFHIKLIHKFFMSAFTVCGNVDSCWHPFSVFFFLFFIYIVFYLLSHTFRRVFHYLESFPFDTAYASFLCHLSVVCVGAYPA